MIGPGFRLCGGQPAAVLSDDRGNIAATLTVDDEGTTMRATRHEPVGGVVHEVTTTWSLPGGHRLAWTGGTLADGSGWTLGIAFRNGGRESVRLRELVLLQTADDGLTVEGDPANWLLTTLSGISRRVASLAEQLPSANEALRNMWSLPITTVLPDDERSTDGRWRRFTDFAILVGEGGRKSLAIGAVGSPEADVRIDCRVDGVRLRLELACEMSDVVVPPGAWRSGQQTVLLHGEHHATVERLLRWCAVTHGARTHRGAEAGWCSYYHFYNDVTAADVLALADHVRDTGLRMPLIQIDAGYHRLIGDWACNAKFPQGWKPVVERIQAAGSTPGIWLGPLMVHESLPLYHEHPDWYQHTADGAAIGADGIFESGVRWLDPTHPGAADCIRGMIRDLHREGFRYFKFDFNNLGSTVPGGPRLRLHDPSKTRFQAMRDLFRIYRDAVGDECYLLACTTFTRAVAGFADATRIGPDTGAVWDKPHPFCLRELIRVCGQTAQANGILFANDPDVMYVKARMLLNEGETRTWIGFVGLLGGTAMTSDPLWIPDRDCGTVRLALEGSLLRLQAKIVDAKVAHGEQPWLGSSLDFYVEWDGQVRQLWLEPAADGHAARILHRVDGKLVEAPQAVITMRASRDGFAFDAEIPLRVFGVPENVASLNWELKASVVSDVNQLAREMATVFGTTAPWEQTTGYGTIQRGGAIERTILQRGWRPAERNYQLLIPPVGERGVSLASTDPEHSRFGFIARRPWGDFGVAQIYNPSAQAADMELDVAGWMGGPCHVWSFWDGAYHGVHEKFVARRLPSHGPMILRLTPADDTRPVVVGSDLHIGCGAAELQNVTDKQIVLNDAGAPDGSLWVAWHGKLQADVPAERVAEGVWRLSVRRERRTGIVVAYTAD